MSDKLYELRQGSGKPPIIRLFRDGDSMCVLYGPNLQEGEAEFEPINDVKYDMAMNELDAGMRALDRLKTRLGLSKGDYVLEIEGKVGVDEFES